jgi:hypothetical protein
MLESGYTLLLEEGVEGTVTMHEKDRELPALLDALAAAGQARWRAFYLVSQPVKLTDAQSDARADQLFGEMWQGFWAEAPEQRARLIKQTADTLGAVSPQTAQMARVAPFAAKLYARLVHATSQLTPEQRSEFAPVMRAVSTIMGHQ